MVTGYFITELLRHHTISILAVSDIYMRLKDQSVYFSFIFVNRNLFHPVLNKVNGILMK